MNFVVWPAEQYCEGVQCSKVELSVEVFWKRISPPHLSHSVFHSHPRVWLHYQGVVATRVTNGDRSLYLTFFNVFFNFSSQYFERMRIGSVCACVSALCCCLWVQYLSGKRRIKVFFIMLRRNVRLFLLRQTPWSLQRRAEGLLKESRLRVAKALNVNDFKRPDSRTSKCQPDCHVIVRMTVMKSAATES